MVDALQNISSFHFLIFLFLYSILQLAFISFILTRRMTLSYYYLFFQRDLVKAAAQSFTH